LTCTVNYSPEASTKAFIFWYHNDRLINFDSSDGHRGVDVRTERHVDARGEPSGMLSRLLISDASSPDSGNYSCAPSAAASNKAHVAVYVLNSGENPAAMQTGRDAKAGADGKHQHELPPVNNASNNKRFNAQTNRHLFHGLLAATLILWYHSSR
jgi:hypothetical protein